MEALHYLARVAAGGDRVDQWFKPNQRTLWLDQPEQVFEIEAEIEGEKYSYGLVIKYLGEPARPVVQSETLRLGSESVLAFEGSPADDDLNRSRSALSRARNVEFFAFREWLGDITGWHINPLAMGSRAEGEDMANLDFTNFASWYRNLVKFHRRENDAFLQDLRESLDDFDQLRLESPGGNLYADFLRDGRRVSFTFGELSDGHRCLICLYAIMHFVVARGGTVIIDEPDNFISLREIQPWLMRIEEIADDNKGQVILISHHPEILNQWAGPYGVQFIRDGAGPVRVEKFKGDPGSSLTVAELVARGWDLE